MRRSRRTGTKRNLCAPAHAALAFGLLPWAGVQAEALARPEPATDRMLIKLRDAATISRSTTDLGSSMGQRIEALAIRRATPMRYVRSLYNGALTVRLDGWKQGSELTELVARLAADPEVQTVGPDRLKRAQNTVPNDPRYGANDGDPTAAFTQQWYLMTPNATLVSAINAEKAWDLSRGSASVPVAVLDSGALFRHPDLGTVANGGKLLPGYDMIGPDNPTGRTYTFYISNVGKGRNPDATDPGDWVDSADLGNTSVFGGTDVNGKPLCRVVPSSWHGTAVAAVIGASTNDGIGIAGVGWNAPVVPVRVLGKCFGYDSDILDGMAWAAGLPISYPDPTSPTVPDNPYPVQIINLSLGSPTACSTFYRQLVSQLNGMNVVVVAAAGNGDGANGSGGAVSEPANCPGVIAVAALRNTGTKVGFSNFGPEVALSAPGGNCLNLQPPCFYSIVSASNSGTQGATDAGMTYVDGNKGPVAYSGQTFAGGGDFGTSFSAPMVSGVIALMLAANPSLTPAQVMSMLQSSARPFPPAGAVPVCPATSPATGECSCTTTTCGAGMLDAYRAVLAAMGNPANPPTLPAPMPIAAPVIPPAPMAQPTSSSPSTSGGGGADAPWWILTLLAAGVVRGFHERAA